MKEVNYTSAKTPKPMIKLTPMQLNFLRANHKLIEVGVVIAKFRGDWSILEKFIALEQYQALFSDTGWDVVYASYQASPNYDFNLSRKLHSQFQLVNRYTGDDTQ